VADPKKYAHPLMCYLAELGQSASKGEQRELQKFVSAGGPTLLDNGAPDLRPSTQVLPCRVGSF